ncbi:MAG: GWxTD domain-containing protein [Cyclobacteriaceae bacterium]
MKLKLSSFCLLILSSIMSSSYDLSSINTAYWYNQDRGLNIKYRVVQKDELTKVFVAIEDAGLQGGFEWSLQDDYEDENHVPLDEVLIDTLQGGYQKVLQLLFERNEKKVLVITYRWNELVWHYPISLMKGRSLFQDFYPANETGLPLLDPFLSESIRLLSFDGEQIMFHGFQYQENFPAADPPMGLVQIVSPSLEVDQAYRNVNNIDPINYHFYLLQTDTLSTDAEAVIASPEHYPKIRRIEEMVFPLRYITKQSEYSRILGAQNNKQAFDQFWLDLYKGNQRIARDKIKAYYQRVVTSNELFTDYKQGWKTDRGMIHIMFGPPNEVYRTGSKEEWVYGNGINFTFRIISNLFSPQLYVLIRDKTYEDVWYEAVKQFRNR